MKFLRASLAAILFFAFVGYAFCNERGARDEAVAENLSADRRDSRFFAPNSSHVSSLRDKRNGPKFRALIPNVRAAIKNALQANSELIAPTLLRLSWHSSGTYQKRDNSGGSTGGRIRFPPESKDPDNTGLAVAQTFLEPIKKKFKAMTYADLYTLAGAVAVEYMGGPTINFRSGRVDYKPGTKSIAKGRLPDASKDAAHLRKVFYRMGLNDQDIVTLSGAHSTGQARLENSGYVGQWSESPGIFSNQFYVTLLEFDWMPVKNAAGRVQYQPSDLEGVGYFMMLPTDMALIKDKKFRKYVEQYADDQDLFFREFAKAFKKLEELGVSFGKLHAAF